MKIRIKFTKQGSTKFIGHLDVMRYFQKVMRRADVAICYSEGYSPHQIMSFASPLGVGMTSRAEYVDIEVSKTDSSAEMLRRINAVMAEGMEALSYRRLPDTAPGAMSIVAAADYVVTFRDGYEPEDWDAFAAGFSEFLKQEQILVMKKSKKGEKETDIRPMIFDASISGRQIRMRVAAGSAANLKPELAVRAYFESKETVLAEFALMTEREEIYAEHFVALEDLGEDIE